MGKHVENQETLCKLRVLRNCLTNYFSKNLAETSQETSITSRKTPVQIDPKTGFSLGLPKISKATFFLRSPVDIYLQYVHHYSHLK